ncbi:phosphatase domain-containing protein [Pseudoroseicyclus aestuarii]|uniref:phosphatase domain-containing protein n=1 Tax=Pseudoroseicyclus aestuarii TaxID=1795041 RepID=UPI000DA1AF03|nr:phosphatase domain-containing protein [Pseudoroseicyclus aestuarii]
MRRLLRRLGLRVERALDWLWARSHRRGDSAPVIAGYVGYSTPDSLVARGRVLSHVRRHEPRADQSVWINLRQMLSLFLTDEVAGVTVRVPDAGVSAVTDAEGYFTLTVPRAGRSGWLQVPVEIADTPEARAVLPVLATQPGARFGTISDIDDTLMHTGAWSLPRNLWVSLTGNVLTRRVHPDAAELLDRLALRGSPVFYVSSSPWNLHDFLEAIFARAGLVRGPLFLRDLGLSAAEKAPSGHFGHKGRAIDLILAANPGLRFVLIGDTGQHDAAIYAAAAARHPGRILRVVLRNAGREAEPEALAALEEAGVPTDLVQHYGAVMPGGMPRDEAPFAAGSAAVPRAVSAE